MGNSNASMLAWARASQNAKSMSTPPSSGVSQYNQESAETLIKRDASSVDPQRTSQLNKAKKNMEGKYQTFLMGYGQYSNTKLKSPSGKELNYPITKDTLVFQDFRELT